MNREYRVGLLTISDRAYLALQTDEAGPLLLHRVREWGWNPVVQEIVPDDPQVVSSILRRWADQEGVDLILTTGGTGLSPRDTTPEATLAVADREAPGLAEWVRAKTSELHPYACLSRGRCVLRGATLILNLPGSPRAVGEYLDCLRGLLPHALEQLRGSDPWGARIAHPGR